MTDKKFTKTIMSIVDSNKPKMEKPNRDQVINADDINNLRIAMNTCSTIDEFISIV